MEAFPNAKIILSIRDPESWYKSVKNTIFWGHQLCKTFPLNILLYFNRDAYDWHQWVETIMYRKSKEGRQGLYTPIGNGAEESVKFFEKWTEDVKKYVPPEKLLIFHAKEGWEPLCEFLDLPKPNLPFPRLNDTEVLRSKFRNLYRFSCLVVIGAPILLSILTYGIYHG